MSRGVRRNALARHLSDSQRKDHVSSASMGDFPGTDIASVDFGIGFRSRDLHWSCRVEISLSTSTSLEAILS